MTGAEQPSISWDRIPEAMRREKKISREEFDEILERQAAREARAPAVGIVAPVFRLRPLDEKCKRTDEFLKLAEACVLGLDLEMPVVLDDMSNEVDEACAALPERPDVIDAEGTIVWRSGPGPWGFDLDGFETALRAQAELG
jgi:hypothetical protein